MEIEVIIPIKSHLKKFLGKQVEIEPFKLHPKANHYSMMLYNLFEKPHLYKHQETDHGAYNDRLNILIPPGVTSLNSRYTISIKHIERYNFYLDRCMRKMIFESMDAMALVNTEKGFIQDGLLAWMNHFNILESEFSYEALQKAYYRHRTRQKENTSEMSS